MSRFQPPDLGLAGRWKSLSDRVWSVVERRAASSPPEASVYAVARAVRRFWRIKVASVPWIALLATLLTVILSGLAGDALKGDAVLTWVPGLEVRQGWVQIGLGVTLLGSAWLVFLKRRELISVGALTQGPAEPRKALVVPLSAVGKKDEVQRVGDRSTHLRCWERGRDAPTELTLTGTDLDEDIRTLGRLGNWSWQQVLRAIRPHARTLRYVCLIGSKDGSAEQLEMAEALISPYLPLGARVVTVKRGVDFDDVSDVMDALRAAIEDLTTRVDSRLGKRLREEDVVVDVTGGMKPTSIAGALITLSSNVTFQYVHTNREDEVWEYDLLHKGASQV